MLKIRMPPCGGYCYEFQGLNNWQKSRSPSWSVESYTPDGAETFQGAKVINGCEVLVFECPDGVLRAVPPQYLTREQPQTTEENRP